MARIATIDRTTKETNFATLEERADEINHLNTSF